MFANQRLAAAAAAKELAEAAERVTAQRELAEVQAQVGNEQPPMPAILCTGMPCKGGGPLVMHYWQRACCTTMSCMTPVSSPSTLAASAVCLMISLQQQHPCRTYTCRGICLEPVTMLSLLHWG